MHFFSFFEFSVACTPGKDTQYVVLIYNIIYDI